MKAEMEEFGDSMPNNRVFYLFRGGPWLKLDRHVGWGVCPIQRRSRVRPGQRWIEGACRSQGAHRAIYRVRDRPPTVIPTYPNPNWYIVSYRD